MDAESPRPVCVDGSDRSVAGSCAFSPDGGTLYYLADFGERTDVCAARRADPSRTWGENGSFRLERLSKDDSGKSLLSVSPDGSKLAWTGKTGEFRIADTNGCVVSSPKTPTQGCAEYVWSPDSRWIAATLGDDVGNHDVWIIPAHDGDINIEAMVEPHLSRFMDEIHAEGHGRDGLVIDVRYNHGGHIADRVLDVLCTPQHSRARFRGNTGDSYLMSYRGRPPLSNLPVVVLCGHESSSNAEIFTHAFKELKQRGDECDNTEQLQILCTFPVCQIESAPCR